MKGKQVISKDHGTACVTKLAQEIVANSFHAI